MCLLHFLSDESKTTWYPGGKNEQENTIIVMIILKQFFLSDQFCNYYAISYLTIIFRNSLYHTVCKQSLFKRYLSAHCSFLKWLLSSWIVFGFMTAAVKEWDSQGRSQQFGSLPAVLFTHTPRGNWPPKLQKNLLSVIC